MNQHNTDLEKKKKLPEAVKIQVDGKIVNELSKQVSSHLFALGELMKNSYDAKATSIDITFDMKNYKLIINDNGDGINIENLQSLLHIAKSGKEYGREFSFNHKGKTITRYTQGSKGLGLFCAFKFGNKVKWDTKFGEFSYSLNVNKEDIIDSTDISLIKFPISKGSRSNNGTTITIEFDHLDPELGYAYKAISNSKNYKKLTNFFYDDSMEINFNLIPSSNSKDSIINLSTISKENLNELLSQHKILDITYNSSTNEIIYKDKKLREYRKTFHKKNNTDDYKISLKLNAYSFPPGFSGVKKIDNIFHNFNGELSPLVYINGVLFNNDQIFNPSITRKIQSSKSLPQLTGFIEIFCTNQGLQFNNERTELIDNAFNDRLKNDLNELNKFLQEEGKKIEKELKTKDSTGRDNGQTDEGQNDPGQADQRQDDRGQTDDERQDDHGQTDDEGQDDRGQTDDEGQDNRGQTDDEGQNTTLYYTPFINLNKTKDIIKFNDQSEIIDLMKYFENAKNSKGENVSINNIDISIDNTSILSPLLSSINYTTTKNIKYSFIDVSSDSMGQPLIVSKTLSLCFIKKVANFEPPNNEPKLIEPIGIKYSFHLKGVDRLVDQLNNLWKNNQEYDMCIAASIRILFDLTTYRFETLTQHQFENNSLENKVKELVEMIVSEKKLVTPIAVILGSRFTIVKNIFQDPGLFLTKALTSNLGSHTGSDHMSKSTIQEIARYAGYYAQLIDAYCRHQGLIDK